LEAQEREATFLTFLFLAKKRKEGKMKRIPATLLLLALLLASLGITPVLADAPTPSSEGAAAECRPLPPQGQMDRHWLNHYIGDDVVNTGWRWVIQENNPGREDDVYLYVRNVPGHYRVPEPICGPAGAGLYQIDNHGNLVLLPVSVWVDVEVEVRFYQGPPQTPTGPTTVLP
jgi:hypothetical protein